MNLTSVEPNVTLAPQQQKKGGQRSKGANLQEELLAEVKSQFYFSVTLLSFLVERMFQGMHLNVIEYAKLYSNKVIFSQVLSISIQGLVLSH